MPRELHSDTLHIDQKPPILEEDLANYDGDIVVAEPLEKLFGSRKLALDYMGQLAFMEEPVTIRIEPSSDKNAPTVYGVWINGKGAEIFENGRWFEITYLPTSQVITVKRKVLERIITAKNDMVHTQVIGPESERPNNVLNRFTSPVASFSIIEDHNPRGPAWVTELRRRNF